LSRGLFNLSDYNQYNLGDITKGKTYTLSLATLQAAFPALSSLSTGELNDGQTIDPVYNVWINQPEHSASTLLINANLITENDTNNTFTVGAGGTALVNLGSNGVEASGFQLDPTTTPADPNHYTMGSGDFETTVESAIIQNPATAGSAWAGFSDWNEWTVSTSFPTFSAGADPHTSGVTFNIAAAGPLGYILTYSDSSTPNGIVQVDLRGLAKIPHLGTTGDNAHTPATDPALTNTTWGGQVMQLLSF